MDAALLRGGKYHRNCKATLQKFKRHSTNSHNYSREWWDPRAGSSSQAACNKVHHYTLRVKVMDHVALQGVVFWICWIVNPPLEPSLASSKITFVSCGS